MLSCGHRLKNPVYLKPGSRRLLFFFFFFYCSSTIVSLWLPLEQWVYLRRIHNAFTWGKVLDFMSYLYTMYEHRKPLDSSHSNDFHPKIHATILKNTTCTTAGFLHTCENRLRYTRCRYFKDNRGSSSLLALKVQPFLDGFKCHRVPWLKCKAAQLA